MTENVKEKDREITYEITEHLGVVSTMPSGWKKELNLVVWNGRGEKYDLRDWDENHKSMSRGITLTKEETKTLYDILSGLEL